MAADPRFFATAGPQRLADILAAAGGQCDGDPERRFTGVAPLQAAGPDEVSFLDNRKYLPALQATRAGAVVLAAPMARQVPAGVLGIVAPSPYLGFARVAALFHPPPRPVPGIHPTAVIGAGATLGEGCEIGAHVVIGAGATSAGTASCTRMRCRAGGRAGRWLPAAPACSISHAIAGRGVVLHPGARSARKASASPRPRMAGSRPCRSSAG